MWSSFLRGYRFLQIPRYQLVLSILLVVFSSLLAVLPVQFVAALADMFVSNRVETSQIVPGWLLSLGFAPAPGIGALIWCLVGFILVSVIADVVRNFFAWYVIKVTERVMHRLRVKSLSAILRRPLKGVQDGQARRAELLDIVRMDTERVQLVMSQVMFTAMSDIFDLLWMAVILATLSFYVPAILLAAIPFLFWISLKAARSQKRVHELLSADEADMNQVASDAIHGIEKVKIFTAEEAETDRFSTISSQVLARRMRATAITSLFFPLGALVKNLAVFAVLSVTVLVPGIAVGVTAGVLLLLFQYSMKFFAPINNFINYYQQVQRGVTALGRVRSVIETEPEPSSETQLVSAAPQISVESLQGTEFLVTDQRSAEVNRQKTVEIPAGSVVLLTGPSGSGKTTLLRSTIGIVHGEFLVCLDGQEITPVTALAARRSTSYASQNTALAHQSLLENCLYPDPPTGPRTAEATALLDQLGFSQQQIDNPEAVTDVQLSGGEQRRLGFARAMLRTSPILLLDEVDANLDAASEAAILKVLSTRMADKTVIIVSHSGAPEWRNLVDLEIHLNPRVAGDRVSPDEEPFEQLA